MNRIQVLFLKIDIENRSCNSRPGQTTLRRGPTYVALFNNHFFHRMFFKQFVDAVADLFFLKKKFLLQRSHTGRNNELLINEFNIIGVLGNGGTHELGPYIFDLQRTNPLFQFALVQKLLHCFL